MAEQTSRFIHIGYPKCASTSLQLDFFARHPQIHFIGWGNETTPSLWIDDELAAAMEVDLRMAKPAAYDAERMRRILQPHFDHAAQHAEYKTLGLSWEALCFTLVYDIDPLTKAQRLHELFGDGTKIVIVIRNQFSLIRSMYFEMVRGGLAKSFSDYLDFLLYYKFTGMTQDLNFPEMVKLYCQLFGDDNVLVVPFEILINDQESITDVISEFLEIEPLGFGLSAQNTSNDKYLLEALRQVNAEQRLNFGAEMFSFLDAVKLTSYWQREGLQVPPAAKQSVESREEAMRLAMERRPSISQEIDAKFKAHHIHHFTQLYGPANTAFAREWQIDLGAMGYPVL